MYESIFLYPVIIMLLVSVFFAFAIKLYPLIFNEKQNYPYEDQIEEALKPYAIMAIFAAYRQSEYYIDTFGERLKGLDKSILASNVYHLISNLDHLDGIPIHLITEDMFQGVLNKVFSEFDGFYIYHQDRFAQLFEQWKQENIK